MLNRDYKNTENLLKVIKLVLWIIPLVLIIWIVSQHLVLDGAFEVKYDVTKASKLVKNFASKESDKLLGSSNLPGFEADFQLITTSPVYFDVKVPRPFQKATISLKYQNPDLQPIIKLGVKQANQAYYYQDMLFLNEALEDLGDYWNKIEEGDLVLWQKDKEYYLENKKSQDEIDDWYQAAINKIENEYNVKYLNVDEYDNEANNKKLLTEEEYFERSQKIANDTKSIKKVEPEYSSITKFLENEPNFESVLQYNYPFHTYLEIPDYKKSDNVMEINNSLRGSHEIVTYLGKNEDMNFIFTTQDINRHQGEDIFRITVYNSMGKKVEEVNIPDDGQVQATGKVSQEQRQEVFIEDLPFGTYRLVLNTPSDDIFIKKIETFQHLLIFKKHIYLTDNEEYKDILGDKQLLPTSVFTNSNKVKARTAHKAGLQTIQVGWQELVIDKRNFFNEITTTEKVTSLISPLNDLYIEGDGFFAFSEDQLFDPNFGLIKNVDWVEDVDEYDYILARYPQSELIDDWFVAEASVEVPYLYFGNKDDKVVNFIFSLPGLPENERTLKIKEVSILFEKEPITIDNFFEKFKSWFQRSIKQK